MQRRRKWLVGLACFAGFVVLFEVTWVLGVNALLNGRWIRDVINHDPTKSTLNWESARTWYPPRVQARGIVYQQHAWATEIEIRASQGAANLRLIPLLFQRVVIDDVDAHDLFVAIVPDPPEGPMPAPEAETRNHVTLEDLRVHSIERLELGDLVVTRGEPTIRANAEIEIDGHVEVTDASLDWRDARITIRDQLVAESISLGFRGGLAPFHPTEDKVRDLFSRISGEIDIEGDTRDLRPLHLLLPDVDWIERLDGAGDVAVHLALDHGLLRKGTDVDVVATELDLSFLGFIAKGSGRASCEVTGSGEDRRGKLEIAFGDFSFARQGSEPLALGTGFVLTASARDFGIGADHEELDVVLDLPETAIPDVALLSAGLPPGLGIELTGGSAGLSGHLEVKGRDKDGTGVFRIHGEELAGRFRDLDFEVELDFVTRVAGRDLDAYDVQIGGTELRLFHGAFDGEEIDVDEGWWMTFGVSEGTTNLRPPATANASLELSMRDTRAVVAAFAEVKRWIRYFDRLLSVEDVAGSARLGLAGPQLSLRDLSLSGEHFALMAELELDEQTSEGIFWAKRGPFSLALERVGDDNDFKLLNDRKWYEEQHAAHWSGDRRPRAAASD